MIVGLSADGRPYCDTTSIAMSITVSEACTTAMYPSEQGDVR